MIGKRGQTLYSLETLVQLVFNRYSDQYHHITIDIEIIGRNDKKHLNNTQSKRQTAF